MKRILITGCHGLLGQKLVKIFTDESFETFGGGLDKETFLDNRKFKYFQLDITDSKRVKEILSDIVPDIVVNTAAITDVDGCEDNKELTWRVNVEGVENLAKSCKKVGAKIIQISTDYVFDGKNGPYDEHSKTNPLGYYGKSKLASENVVVKYGIPFAIVRTMVLYGVAKNLKKNFVLWLIEKLQNKQNVNIVIDQISSPTLADNLAEAIYWIVELDKEGTYHVSGSEIIDRYTFALKIAEFFGFDSNFIRPIKTEQLKQKAKRPLNSGFIVKKAEEELMMKFFNIEESLNIVKQQLEQTKT
jgi:dTDP-4-dehydrorhamnose reductase